VVKVMDLHPMHVQFLLRLIYKSVTVAGTHCYKDCNSFQAIRPATANIRQTCKV